MSSTSPERGSGSARTRIIAHRGASGYLPEHSAVAKALAFGLGADFLEQDVVATRDAELVVLHDLFLEDVSNVATRMPGRVREDGHWYVIDFTFEELRELSLRERRRHGAPDRLYAGRYPYETPGFGISRLEDEIELVAGLNATMGRRVGIYPEIKDPVWHERHGIDLTGLVHATLERMRPKITGPVFVQSFDEAALRRLQDEFASHWPRVRLLDGKEADALTANAEALTAITAYADGVGLPFDRLIDRDRADLRPSALALALTGSRLLIHPYTLRRDVQPPHGISYAEALGFLIHELGVDALFCDQPDDAVAIRENRQV